MTVARAGRSGNTLPPLFHDKDPLMLPSKSASSSTVPFRTRPDTVPLSDREWQVLDLVVGGMTNRAAASRLGISERTVREHIARIFLKLRVGSRVEAAVIATEWRLIGQQRAAVDHGAVA
jgi:DNA-binding NarL/FixJ family response regulator